MWNYNPANSDIHGDSWNGENFSFFAQRRALPSSLLSLDQTSPTLDNGGRLLRTVVRPYAAKVAGIPLKWKYEVNTGECEFEWVVPYSEDAAKNPKMQGSPTVGTPPLISNTPIASNTTEIFFPVYLSQDRAISVTSSDSSASSKFASEYVPELQTLYIRQLDMTAGQRYHVKIRLEPGLKQVFELNDFWTDFIGYIYLLVGIVIGFVGWFVVGLI